MKTLEHENSAAFFFSPEDSHIGFFAPYSTQPQNSTEGKAGCMHEASQVSSTSSTAFPFAQDSLPPAQILEIQPLACTQESTEVSSLFQHLSHPHHPLCLCSFVLPLKG